LIEALMQGFNGCHTTIWLSAATEGKRDALTRE